MITLKCVKTPKHSEIVTMLDQNIPSRMEVPVDNICIHDKLPSKPKSDSGSNLPPPSRFPDHRPRHRSGPESPSRRPHGCSCYPSNTAWITFEEAIFTAPNSTKANKNKENRKEWHPGSLASFFHLHCALSRNS